MSDVEALVALHAEGKATRHGLPRDSAPIHGERAHPASPYPRSCGLGREFEGDVVAARRKGLLRCIMVS